MERYGVTWCSLDRKILALWKGTVWKHVETWGNDRQSWAMCARSLLLGEHPGQASPASRGRSSLGSENLRGLIVKPKARVALGGIWNPGRPPSIVVF